MKRYRELADELAESIRAGTLRPGERMPSVRELCRDRRVSPATAMHAYEAELSRELIGIIESVPGTHIRGITDLNRLDERVPTVSFTLAGKRPEAVATEIGKHHIYVWNGHNYALAIVERMGLLDAGGMIRVGPVHYNTKDELVKFGEVLEKIAK